VTLLPHQTKRWIVAHRGVSDRCPENSQAAFQAAVDQQADAIECDVQFTADERIVVCHDETFERYGHPGVRVSATTFADLQTLDMGSWFDKAFSCERLLSSDDLLSEFGPQVPLLLEIKNADNTPSRTTAFLKQLVALIETHCLQDQVAVLCFETNILQQLREIAPAIVLVLNTHQPQSLHDNDLKDQPWLNAIDGNIQQLSHSHVQRFRQHGLTPLCFTCNSEEHVRKAHDLGVDAIITNDPGRTRRILCGPTSGRHS